MKKLLIYGAGAIGRGFIPWVFHPSEYEFNYVEKDQKIRELLNKNKKFHSYKTIENGYDELEVSVNFCFEPGQEIKKIQEVDAIITAVGPRNVISLKESLATTNVPVICCENDSTIPETLKKVTNNGNVVFAIPDVITSNSAPENLLKQDPLSVVTENGICYIDEHVSMVGGDCRYVSKNELRKQWLVKLYIHNTPHCIAAYLGNLLGITYLHEAMQNEFVKRVVSQAMHEMEQMLLRKYNLNENFVKAYSIKELQRFSNTLLFDPITRVAREPFRKLAPNDRLIGAAELCLSSGIVPENVMIGIMSAFCYDNKEDPDYNIKYLMQSLDPKDFLKIIIGLREGESLFEIMENNWNDYLQKLNELRHD